MGDARDQSAREPTGRRKTAPRPPSRRAEARIADLEARIAELEARLETARLAPPPAPPPEAPERPGPKPGPRCPGCHLPVESAAQGDCPWCGFVFDALAELRRAAKGRRRERRA